MRLAATVAAALGAGACGALAHPPFGFAPAIVATACAGFILLRHAPTPVRAALAGAALGVGYFAITLSWIIAPFQVDAATTGWMAPFAVVLLALLLGTFWAVAFGFARWAGGRPWMLGFAWVGAELLRAYVFTGFPWAMLPQALVDAQAGQALALGGPHGVMAMLMLGAAALTSVRARIGIPLAVLSAAALAVPVIGPDAPLTPHTVRLIQPNAPQDEKWDPQKIPIFVNRQIEFTAAVPDIGPAPDLIAWPETALPYLVENAQPVFDVIADAAGATPVVIGMQRRDARGGYYNGLVVLEDGAITQSYDKHHLVPFGEYMPFKWLFRRLGVRALAERAETGYVAGPGPRLLDFGTLGRALPLICYEAVFAHDVGAAPARPAFLMQLTNDAWFGMRSGPQQHLAQARMRAIEQGLPMLRAANTGISAAIDPQGRITAALGLNTAGYLDVTLPAPSAPTLYARSGDLPWVLIVMAGLIGAVLRRARTRRTHAIDAGPDGT